MLRGLVAAAVTALFTCAPASAAHYEMNISIPDGALPAKLGGAGTGYSVDIPAVVLGVGDVVDITFTASQPIRVPYGYFQVGAFLVGPDFHDVPFVLTKLGVSYDYIGATSISPLSGSVATFQIPVGTRAGNKFDGNSLALGAFIGGPRPAEPPYSGSSSVAFTGFHEQVTILSQTSDTVPNPQDITTRYAGAFFYLLPLSVPEPATWAMMLMGFAAAGCAARRPKTRRAAGATTLMRVTADA